MAMNQLLHHLSDREKQAALHFYNFAKNKIEPIAESINQNKQITPSTWLELGANSFLGIRADKQFGGQALSYTMQCIAMQEISAASPSLGLSYAAHENLCINQLIRFGSNNQLTNYLPKLISGAHIGALAISEENAGSDAMSMELTAIQTNNGYILNGRKKWITNGPIADVIIVYASSLRTSDKNKLSAFIIDKNIKNWKTGNIPNKIGMLGSLTSEIIFENCFVPNKNILGKANEASKIMMSGLDYERLILTAGPIGIMRKCIEITKEHLQTRKQFNSNLGSFQLMQAKIADMYTKYMAASTLMFATAYECDNIDVDSTNCAACFLFAAESATEVASQTVQALGAKGYSTDFAAAQLLADTKLYEIGGGTTEIRRLIIGKNILKTCKITT